MLKSTLTVPLLFAITLITGISAHAQFPDAPQPHKFLDKKNISSFGALAFSFAGDGYTTNRLPNGTHELNPIARPFVGSARGTAVYFGSGFAAAIGGEYLLHRTNHHRIERIVPWAAAAVEGFWIAHNIALQGKQVNSPVNSRPPIPSPCFIVHGMLACKF